MLRTNLKNTSNHTFCLMKLNGLKECYSNEIAPQDIKMCLGVLLWSHESFIYFHSFQCHFHNNIRAISDFKRFFENLKNGSIYFFQNVNHVCLIILTTERVQICSWSRRLNPRKICVTKSRYQKSYAKIFRSMCVPFSRNQYILLPYLNANLRDVFWNTDQGLRDF